MSDVVIRAENLGKKYTIGHTTQRERYTALRDVLARGMQSAFRKAKDLALGRPIIEGDELEEVWALRDVNFEVRRGEVIGVIGRNGAGKSTLLKILSRITEPSTGRVTIKGRVASLLEVGTGFHPELSGRENIYLNGAILGMRRQEIQRKFDEIVAFAEIEKFLDTPVKRYSSGMYVRLAFAVAAHLDPEILVVDEVLAVGDTRFQNKCLGKLQDVTAREGRTVFFVSHHMPSIQRLCSRTLLLNSGCLFANGKPSDVIGQYLSLGTLKSSTVDLLTISPSRRRGSGVARFSRVRLLNANQSPVDEILQGEPITVELEVLANQSLRAVMLGFSFVSMSGIELMGTSAHDGMNAETNLVAGFQRFSCCVDPMVLCPGRYILRAAIFARGEVYDHVDEIVIFDVLNAAHMLETTPRSHYVGHIYLPYKWTYDAEITKTG